MCRWALVALVAVAWLGRSQALFGWGESSEETGPVKSDMYGCVAWKGVNGCRAASDKVAADGGLDKDCHAVVGSRVSGYCQCAWGEEARVDCGHAAFNCVQVCYSKFERGKTGEDEAWLKGTVWHWNNWRDIKLMPNGVFLAPTEECSGEECFWMARKGILYIMWGNAGLHTVKIADKSLEGVRFDGETCSATFRRIEGSDEDNSYGQDPDENEEEKEKEDDLYEVLGLDPEDADDGTIKKAFRKLSKEYHPDRVKQSGADPVKAEKKFDRIRAAYEVLSDVDKRMLYDTGGMKAVKEHVESEAREGRHGGGGMFGWMFGFGGEGRRGNRGEDVQYHFTVSLADLYKGNKVQTQISRRVVCRGCSKVTNKNRERCNKCGRCPPETHMVQKQMGSFILNQQEQVPSKEKCMQEAVNLDVEIERGMGEDERIVFPRMGEQTPGQLPGDIALVVKQKPHDQFLREGNDLRTVVHIPLKAALTGFSHSFAHLDDHVIELETDPVENPAQIIKPNEERRLKNEGMPVHNVPSQFGDLIVTFEVVFPDHLTAAQMEKLREIL